jgi:integrase
MWFRESKQAWYTTIHGEQVYLGKDKPAAKIEFRRQMITYHEKRPIKAFKGNVWELMDSFLDDASLNTSPSTYDWYKTRLQYFKDDVQDMPVRSLKPFHVKDWLNGKQWGPTFKAGVITALKRVFNWAVEEERIEVSPIRSLKKPAAEHRELTITAEDFANILLKLRKDSFRDILTFVWLTGCRPQEARAIEARWIKHNERIVVFPVKKSKGKKRSRVIHLTDEAYTILAKWALKNSDGPVFRNRLKSPWTANAFACRFQRLKAKIGMQLTMYALRHSYAHNGLTKSGIAPEVMAALLGHTDTRTLYAVYGHLLKATEFMRAAAEKARPSTCTSEQRETA